MAQPDLIITPFGENAAPGTIEAIPETLGPGDLPQQASWNAGFPGVTMTPLAAGGIPPRGQDFNGVLKAISEHTVFVGGGGRYKWDANFAAAGGYPLGAVLQKAGNDGFWLNLVDGNATNPDSGGANWIDASNTTFPYALDTGAANAYVATYAPALSALATGQVVRFKASNANTGASTFNPNGLGAKPIIAQGGAALGSGAIASNSIVWLQYDAGIGAGSWVLLLATNTPVLATQPEAEGGTNNTKFMSPLRVWQAVAAWWNTASTAFGRSLVAAANAAAGRTVLELGNAATSTVQANSTDTTAGRLMVVGAFGLGGAWTATADLNTLVTSGLYTTSNSTATGRPADGFWSILHQSNAAGTNATQIAVAIDSSVPAFYVRSRSAGTWSPWERVAKTDSPAFTGTPTAPTAAPGTNTTQLATTAFVSTAVGAVQGIGVGQTWQDVTASRLANTVYTNTSGRPIEVAITATNTNVQNYLSINGVPGPGFTPVTTGTITSSVTAIIPAGATYTVPGSGSGLTLVKWSELR